MSDDDAAAVNAALSSDWKRAEAINKKILDEKPLDIDCLNRLGKAYLELGENKKAVAVFRKVLKINKYDPIAQKNLNRALQVKPFRKPPENHYVQRPAADFLEEPGKTKLVNLVNVASGPILLEQSYADRVALTPRRHTMIVTNLSETYLGALPDDLARRLLLLTKGGNRYECFVKSVCKNAINVFIRETFRAKRFAATPSFSSSNIDYFSSVREDLLDQSEQNKPAIPSDDESDSEDPRTQRETGENESSEN